MYLNDGVALWMELLYSCRSSSSPVPSVKVGGKGTCVALLLLPRRISRRIMPEVSLVLAAAYPLIGAEVPRLTRETKLTFLSVGRAS